MVADTQTLREGMYLRGTRGEPRLWHVNAISSCGTKCEVENCGSGSVVCTTVAAMENAIRMRNRIPIDPEAMRREREEREKLEQHYGSA